MRSFGTATVAVFLWLAVALAIDRWLLAPYCATCASALALELKVRLPAAELTYPPVSVLVLIVLPMLLLAIFLVPWRYQKNRQQEHREDNQHQNADWRGGEWENKQLKTTH